MLKRWLSVERVERIALEAIAGGYGVPLAQDDPYAANGWRRVELTVRHNCENPRPFVIYGRVSATHGKRVHPMTVYGQARCRKCEPCKEMRSRFWTGRACSEFRAWPRTVFGTFTMSLENHYALDARAIARLHDKGVNWNALTEADQFVERAAEFGRDLRLWLKRIRKGEAGRVKPRLRYLLVAEAHNGARTNVELRGRPHYHILIHETELGSLVDGNPLDILSGLDRSGEWEARYYKLGGQSKRGCFVTDEAFLRRNWTLGFTKFQLAETERAASYLCKYLSKSMMARVRASYRYGDAIASRKSRETRDEPSARSKGSVNVRPPNESGLNERKSDGL